MKTLLCQGICENPFRVLRLIFQEASARSKLENSGEQFSLMREVSQGDPFSPKLFSTILEDECQDVSGWT